jgi:hypothetical protein
MGKMLKKDLARALKMSGRVENKIVRRGCG